MSSIRFAFALAVTATALVACHNDRNGRADAGRYDPVYGTPSNSNTNYQDSYWGDDRMNSRDTNWNNNNTYRDRNSTIRDNNSRSTINPGSGTTGDNTGTGVR